MPESTCLHIQDRESGPIRVVELPWISVRIGRASFCEVRLADHDLAAEACRLKRQGRTWTLMPVGGRSTVLLEGRSIDGPCPLPFDVPFRIGPYCLTLRHDVAAEPDWGMYPGPMPSQLPPPRTAPEPVNRSESERDRPGTGSTSPSVSPQERSQPAGDPGRWESRWRAAEAQLKARSDRLRAKGDTQPTPHTARLEAMPRRERPTPRSQAAVAPRLDSAPRPIPTPKTRMIEPGWAASQPESPPAAPRIEPAVRPVPTSSATRFEPAGTRVPPQPSVQADAPELSWADRIARDRPVDSEAVAKRLGFFLKESELDGTPEGSPIEPASTPATPAPAGPLSEPLSDGWGHRLEGDAPREPLALEEDDVRTSVAIVAPLVSADEVEERSEPIEHVAPPTPGTAGSPRSEATPRGGTSSPNVREWPSVRDILANHRPGPSQEAGAAARIPRSGLAMPTVAREPDQWALPLWLAWPPIAMGVLVAGLTGCVLSWWWASDSYSAALMTDRLIMADGTGRRRPMPDSVVPPDGRWVSTTAQHLAHWAIFLSGDQGKENPSAQDVGSLLGKALQVSPLNPTARLAQAQLEPRAGGTARSIRNLGLSRDAVSLSWSARGLLDAGKREAALRLYGQALTIAARGESSRTATPRFNDDPSVRRYLLPGEMAVRAIAGELASRSEWTFREWSRALPRDATVLLATARLLHEQGRNEAEALIDGILDEPQTRASADPADSFVLAARAEALAFRLRWKDAEQEYRQAIELIDNETIRRSWWFNLADIAFRLNDEPQRQTALRAALAVANSDEITRRATEIQRGPSGRPRLSLGGAKAN